MEDHDMLLIIIIILDILTLVIRSQSTYLHTAFSDDSVPPAISSEGPCTVVQA